MTCRIQNPDIPRAGRGGVAHGGPARSGWAGREGTSTVRLAPATSVPGAHQGTKATVLNVSSEARTKEFLCKPVEKQNPRLTRGLATGPQTFFVPGC